MGAWNNRAGKWETEANPDDKKRQAQVHKELDAIVTAHVPTVRFAAAGEIVFVKRLIAKYGDDYVSMARDHKMNIYQHTPKMLRRKCLKVQGTLELATENGIDTTDAPADEEAA